MRVLISAYGCEPGSGSEPGVGWYWVREAVKDHQVWVITRANNKDAIEAVGGISGVEFVYYDLPHWAAFYKRGARGVQLYYALWQFGVARKALELHARVQFDLIHHLTWSTFWQPSMVWRVPVPFVLGPIGGGVSAPWALWRSLGFRGLIFEVSRVIARTIGLLNPFVRHGWKRASVILVQNQDTLSRLPPRVASKALLAANAGIDESEIRGDEGDSIDRSQSLVFVGRLIPLKGVTLALRALAHEVAKDFRLVVVGEGRDLARCKSLVSSLGIDHRVRFTGRLERHEVLAAMDSASVFIFPSLHDEAPLTVIEALGRGLPVVCLDHGGPAFLVGDAGIRVPIGKPTDVIAHLARAAVGMHDDVSLSRAATERARQFTWSAKRELISAVYAKAFNEEGA